jgi:CheY-like chemotaxis protein
MTKILLVEDDKSLREIYGVRLLAEGYDIVSAGDGEEALAMAIKERPELIVSDVMMPKISGFDMLDILRSTTETKDIKVIMMTALSSEDQRLRGEQLGADRYLVKSQVGIEDVVRTVHDVLQDIPTATPTPQQTFGTPAPSAVAQPQPAVPATPAPMPVPSHPQASAAPMPAPTTPAAPASSQVAPQPAAQPHPAAPVTMQPQQTPAQAAPAPAPTPAPAPAAPTFTAPEPQPASQLPQPTAPFSTPRPANLGDRIIQPLSAPPASVDMSDLMQQELSAAIAPPPAPHVELPQPAEPIMQPQIPAPEQQAPALPPQPPAPAPEQQ